MLRNSRNILAVVIVIAMSRSIWAAADEPSEMLARAEALYYEADFAKSVELLLRADELLRNQPGQLQEKTDVKLQLALGFIGLNDSNQAKVYLGQLYALDADHQVDPQMFSPKVIKLAEEARAEQNELRCRILSDDAQEQLDKRSSDGVLKVIESGRVKCAGLASLYPKAGDLLFKEGLSAYKSSRMEDALPKFRAALRLDPKNELAGEYVDLTVSKLEVAADRALYAWRKDYEAGDFSSANRDYRELTSRASSEKVNEVRAEYRQALARLVDLWNAACAKDDRVSMERVRQQVNALLPEPAFADDILAKMTTCTHTGCVQMSSPLALARLKTRVDPQFPPMVASQITTTQITVRVKATINEKGEVAAKDVQSENSFVNNAVKAAVEQWKFFPAVIESEARCVDTEIPIVISKSRN
jgi:thioredoxin-like negative regulator of GroEL